MKLGCPVANEVANLRIIVTMTNGIGSVIIAIMGYVEITSMGQFPESVYLFRERMK